MVTVAKTPRVTTVVPSVLTAGPFYIGFRLFEKDAVEVYINGTRRTDFTVLATFVNGYDDSAFILLNAPVPAGVSIRIDGAMRSGRASEYKPTDPSVIQKINIEFARVWAMLLELRRDGNRALRSSMEGPVATLAEGQTVMWTSEGFKPGPDVERIYNAQATAAAQTAEAAAQATAATAQAAVAAAQATAAGQAASAALTTADQATTAAQTATTAAQAAANFAQAAAAQTVADLGALIAISPNPPVGTTILTRAEGFGYRVVSSDPDRTTTGGALLRVTNGGPLAYGAIGNGVTNDSAAFAKFESRQSGKVVDLEGRTFVVSGFPTLNSYHNGFFRIGGVSYPAALKLLREWGNIVAAGDGALKNFGPTSTSSQSLIVMGKDAGAAAAPNASGGVVIGDGAHEFSPFIPYQTVAIGKGALARVQPVSSSLSSEPGNRNTAVGAYAGLFTTTGFQNVFLGRNTGSGITSGSRNTALGTGALSGEAPVGLGGEVINIRDMTGVHSVAVGWNAGKRAGAVDNSVFVGSRAGMNIVEGSLNTIVGDSAGVNLNANSAINGKLYIRQDTFACTYSQSGTAITLTCPAGHGISAGNRVAIVFTSGPISDNYTSDQVYCHVSSVSGNTVVLINYGASLTGSGSAEVRAVFGSVDSPTIDHNTLIGYAACSDAVTASGVTSLGYRAGTMLTDPVNATFLGRYSGASTIAGTDNTAFGSNVTAVGNGARLSGNNQMQLGDNGISVYAQSAIQVRSDARDKTDVRPTSLGLGFLRDIAAVEHRWDMRDDYVDEVPKEDRLEWWSNPIKDGSKARRRFHQGVVAQQVQEACARHGVDFSGLQDHAVNGGLDVLTVAYEHFVPPLIRAVQELAEKLDDLKGQVEGLKAPPARKRK